MSNTRKKDPRVTVGFTIKTSIKKKFRDYCDEHELSSSRIVNDMIQEYLKSKGV